MNEKANRFRVFRPFSFVKKGYQFPWHLKQITLDLYYDKNDRYHTHMVRTHSNYGWDSEEPKGNNTAKQEVVTELKRLAKIVDDQNEEAKQNG